jgi:hypothetical protein
LNLINLCGQMRRMRRLLGTIQTTESYAIVKFPFVKTNYLFQQTASEFETRENTEHGSR